MPNVRNLSRSFAAGEITPELFGRVDLDQFQTGLATCRNFFTMPHGPAANRAGFAYVLATINSANKTRLIPFTYSITQTMVLAFADKTLRFHTAGKTLLETSKSATTAGGVITAAAHGYVVGDWIFVTIAGVSVAGIVASVTANTFTLTPITTVALVIPDSNSATIARVYTVVSPYAEADLFDLHYVQSADVLTITHPNYPPKELRRLGANDWEFSDISFVPSIGAPTGITAAAITGSTGTPNNVTYTYCVTALKSGTLEESLPTGSASCVNDLTLAGYTNVIQWGAASGASTYNVYKMYQGRFCFMGQTSGLQIIDNNITPDTSTTPPVLSNPFSGASNYPGAVSYYQQRRTFASTTSLPQTMWMTRSGTESNLSASIPSEDTDALNFRIAAREANTIRHIVPLSELILLTSSAEWAVTANGSAAVALTPSTLSVQPQGYTGSSNVTPITVSNSLLYAAALGGHVYEMTYNYYANGYVSQDVCVMAPHLFDFFTIADMAYAKAPYPICWFVSSNGDLVALTYSPAQKVTAWHHHDTDGLFESVCVVTEGQESVVYAVVNRTINGMTARYVERLHTRQIDTLDESFFVDCGVAYSGTSRDTLTGLDHLEGKTVNILADGAVHPPQLVKNGQVALQAAATTIAAGLPITADLQTLPFSFQTEGYGQGRVKNINKVWIRVRNSSGVMAGPDYTQLVQYKQRTTEPYGTPPNLVTGEIEIVLPPSWQQDGSVCIRQTDPLPLIVTSMTIEASIGG